MEKVRIREQRKFHQMRRKEELVRKRENQAQLKKETLKWEREIKKEEKRQAKILDDLKWKGKKKFRDIRRRLDNKLKKIGKNIRQPFEVIKTGSNSNARFTTYFDTYTIKINKFPVDPVNVFQKALDMTINERELVTGDKIRLIVSHPTWTKPFSTKLLTITNDKNFIYELIKAVIVN